MRRVLGSFAAALALAGAPTVASAQLYDNGAPNGVSGNELTVWVQAEDFTLAAPATLTSVRFWGFGLGATLTEFAGTITWRIYSNAGTEPGAVLFSGTAAPTAALRGPTNFGSSFQFDFGLPDLALGAGTYWLGLHNGPLGTTDRREFYWESTANNATLLGREDVAPFDTGGWVSNNVEHAFQLNATVTAIPEPSTYALLASGLIAVAGIARRRAR